MSSVKLQKTIQKQSKEYVSLLNNYENDFRNSINTFLTSNVTRCLVIETKYTRLFAIRTKTTLIQLNDDHKNQKALKKYVDAKNQLFFRWKKFQDLVGSVAELPGLTSLVVCEFYGPIKMKKVEVELLEELIESLYIAKSRKVIFITSQKGILDKYLKDVRIITFLKIDELSKNNLSSKKFSDKCKAFMEEASKGNTGGIKDLLNNGVDVNITIGADRSTALHVAAEKGHKDVVLTLLKNGANILPNKSGCTALHLAARNGHNDVVLILLKSNCDINLMDRSKRTALHHAVANDHRKVTDTLLKHHANVDARTKEGFNSLYIATSNNNVKVVKVLLQHGAQLVFTKSKDTALHLAASKGFKDVIALLLEYNVDVNIKGWDEWTALHYAVGAQHNEIVEALLKYGVICNVQNGRGLRMTPLHKAASKNNSAAANMLLKYGADINGLSDMGNSPLHYAAYDDSVEVAQLLMERGASVEVINKFGNTAWDWAVGHRADKVLALFRTYESRGILFLKHISLV